MNNVNKYSADKLSDAIDDAIDVSFNQMVDTVRTQCYRTQTVTSEVDCESLEFLEDMPMDYLNNGRDIRDSIKSQMKRIIISELTDSDWVGDIQKNLIDMITPLIRDTHNEQDVEDLQHMNLEELQDIYKELSVDIVDTNEEDDISPSGKSKPSDSFGWDTPQIDDTDDLFHFGEYKNSNKFFQTNNKTHCYLNDSENSVMILALETLLEQVRDARDFEQIARVKNLLDSWKTLDDSRK